jgi:hypothetical protein
MTTLAQKRLPSFRMRQPSSCAAPVAAAMSEHFLRMALDSGG